VANIFISEELSVGQAGTNWTFSSFRRV